MFGVKIRFDVLPAVVGFVSLLLLGLGFLQYRWTGDLSEAERGRMRASLHERASQMARELDREITRAILWLSVDGEAIRSGDYAAYAERYAQWRAVATEPGLVKEIYVWRADEGSEERRALRFSPEKRTFEPADATALAELRERVPSGSPSAGATPTTDRPPRNFFGPLDLLDDGTPIGRMPMPSFERGPRSTWLYREGGRAAQGGPEPPRLDIVGGPGGPPRWSPGREAPRTGPGGPPGSFGMMVRVAGLQVVVFDRDVLTRRLLPALARRHFPGEGTDGFDLTVRRRDRPGEVVYAREGKPAGRGETHVGLLELRFEEVSEEDLRRIGGPLVARTDGRRGPGDRRGFAGRFLRGPGADEAGLWEMQVAYRGGSVDALVAAARRRNLAVSFSVLVLLGAATALLASAARRARRLAERQMEFVAAVSHELRTPVSVICSAGENLADGVISGPAGVTRYGELVRDEGRRLARLIEQILDFAGSYTGRRSYKREPVAVERVIDEALSTAAPFVAEAGFEISREVGAGLPTVEGDAPALARAVRNLVENAVKYGGEDRTVAIRVRSAERAGRPFVRIEVEDKGLGIPADEQKQLFEPFWRGKEARERQIRGSGLGLALVRSIARAHGGEVTVESQAGRGSVFGLELPAAERPPAAAETVHPDDSGAKDEEHDIAHPAG